MNFKKQQEVELTITSLAFGGKGIGKIENYVIFVDGAIPGQKVKASLKKIKKRFAEAQLLEILQQSPLAVEPRCRHYDDCGGCQLQHLNYESQLTYKRQHVVDCLERIGGFSVINISDVVPAPKTFFYRNKMEFTFSDREWIARKDFIKGTKKTQGGLFLGLHAPGRFSSIIDIKECFLLSEKSNEILHEIRDFARLSDLPAYSTLTHEGFWRFVVLREAKVTGERMINLVTSRYEERTITELAKKLVEVFPETTSIINTITAKKSEVATGERKELLFGEKFIHEKIGSYTFDISADSFFQTNSLQAEVLYSKILELADLNGDEIVYDLYCGTGSIGIYLSAFAQKIVGFEVVESALADAKRNCERNGVNNCEFVAGDLRDSLQNIKHSKYNIPYPDVIVIDPPRAGMHSNTVEAIIKIGARKIVHVSCNPATLARDLKLLCAEGYRVSSVIPVDMFPNTWHIEAVALLVKE